MHGHTIISYSISLYGTINLMIFFTTLWGVKLLLIYNKNDVNNMVLKTRPFKEPKKRLVPNLTWFLSGVFWFFVCFDRTSSRSVSSSIYWINWSGSIFKAVSVSPLSKNNVALIITIYYLNKSWKFYKIMLSYYNPIYTVQKLLIAILNSWLFNYIIFVTLEHYHWWW